MSFLLNTSNLERKTFERHFLSSVHSEIRYKVIDIERILDNKDRLDSEFKEFGFTETRTVTLGEFKLEAKVDKAQLSQQTVPVGIVLTSQSPKYELRIERDKIVYSDFSYEGFDEYHSKFRKIIDKVGDILSFDGDFSINKVGLKKINAVQIQPFSSFRDGLGIFNLALFSIARSGLLKFEKFRISEETIILEETNENLFVLRTKLVKPQENSIEATLDYDFVKLGKELSVDEVFSNILPSLNQSHFDLFMWSVTDDMRNIMGQGV